MFMILLKVNIYFKVKSSNDLGSLSPGVIQSKECVSMKVLRKTQSNDSDEA